MVKDLEVSKAFNDSHECFSAQTTIPCPRHTVKLLTVKLICMFFARSEAQVRSTTLNIPVSSCA